MKKTVVLACAALALWCGCRTKAPELPVKTFDPAETAKMAAEIEKRVQPEVDSGLTIKLWGVDSLVISPIAIDIDNFGRLYYTTTERQKNSEFDIRAHSDWEIRSISLRTVEDRRAFLREELSPENSARNTWLADLNGDSSHDWRDLTLQKEKIYRVEDLSGDGVADQSSLVVHDFHEEVTDVAGGVFADGDDIYVTVAPDLWKLTDTDGDGIPDKKKSISHGYGIHVGFSGHGMSGVKMGPDGRLYWQIGDIGFSGKGPDGTKWEHPNSGVIARSNPDGSDFEIFAHGLRNTHQFVFDAYGNIISVDNDGDHPGEKERLVYIVNGSDAGWRSNWQYGKYNDPNNNTYKVWMEEKMFLPRFEGQAAYITPCITNYVGGPAGVAFNPGTALGSRYTNSFFVAEFYGNPSSSGVHHFKLEPKGASFELGLHKKVLGGILATGLDFGPDGGLYIADWIDGWETHDYGRIWKLDDQAGASSPSRKETKDLMASDFSKKKIDELATLLRHQDMRVRQSAQFALVKRGKEGLDVLQAALAQTENQLARIHAIWGISQAARQSARHASLLLPALTDADAEIRAQAVKWLGDIRYREAADKIIPLLKDSSARVRFFAAEALGRMSHNAAIAPILNMLEANNDEDAFLRHAGALALSRIGKSEPLTALGGSPSRALRIAAVVALRRMADPGIAAFLNDQDEFIVTETARAINDDLSIEGALPALAAALNSTPFANEALIRRAISANLRVGKPENLDNLIAYARRGDRPADLRAEAVDALSTWAKPSVLDRVDGRHRGSVERDAASLRAATTDFLTGLVADPVLAVRLSAARAIDRLRITRASDALLAQLKKDPAAEMRTASLKALVGLDVPQQAEAIRLALNDREKPVRVAGLGLLENMTIAAPMMVELLANVIENKTIEEKQAAIITLGKAPLENTQPLFTRLLDRMERGQLDPAVYLELGESIDSTRAESLITRYRAISAKSAPDKLLAGYFQAQYGGDERQGRRIFFQNQQAQCMRCHSYDDRGGNAGPRLNGVGGRLSREELLEALIDPSKRISPGYGIVSLELDNGENVSGTFQGEDARGITIRKGQEPDQVYAHKRIRQKKFSPSSMFNMQGVLSAREIRDVVSFLSTLKKDN